MLIRRIPHFFTFALLLALLIPSSRAANIELPSLGDTTSAVISQQQEYELGQAWLRAYRSRIPEFNDPELHSYLEQLLVKLAVHSQLEDHRLSLVAINNPTMNAFAVPGGVIGVHLGLFRYAKSEHQLASVLAHELAHLSQRHFARRVAEQRKNSMTTMAGMLASLVLAATVGGDAGIAAMTATQAASLQNTLRYSRQNEQEADRLGIETIYASGMDPAAVGAMFEEMLRATRYTGSKPPEFLLTHPLTESRVADAKNRIAQYPPKYYPDNVEFHLMRVRALIAIDQNPSASLDRFQRELSGDSLSREAARYGTVLAYAQLGEMKKAREAMAILLKESPDRVTYRLEDITLDRQEGKFISAIEKSQQLLRFNGNSYPLRMSLAETYLKANRYTESEQILRTLAVDYPETPYIWFQLAEVSGLAGNIAGVHKARAQYFLLNGVFDKAREQLGYARKLLINDFKEVAIIDQQLRDLAELEKKMKDF
ncbi:MAG: M48 family metalloprotease [Porticoccaceae bacterium]